MTPLSRLLSIFPLAHGAGTVAVFVAAFSVSGNALLAAFLFAIGFSFLYLLPPFLFRFHNRIFGLNQGLSSISGKDYSSWWGGHQIQGLYIALPVIETLLRLCPGAYSAWLRLWGARVGRGVYWTPHVEIVDRSLIDVGDFVVFGHKSAICSHVITPKEGELRLYVRDVRIGSGVLVGAAARLGPGTRVEAGCEIPYATSATVNQRFRAP